MSGDRTWLFVPAKEKYRDKIESIEADNLILDLEDSLTQEQKEPGLKLVSDLVEKYGCRRKIYVRVNSGRRMDKELKALALHSFSGYVVPKFEDTQILEEYRELIKEKQVIALVESIRGVIFLEQAAAHPLITGLAFGGEDFCRDLGYGAGEEAACYARSKMVLYGAYHRKETLDTVSFEFRDKERFLGEYEKSKRMGFTGKLLIHPRQAEAVREYGSAGEIKRLRHIVEVFRSSADGVVQIDGKWYEKPHIEKIESYLHSLEGETKHE